MYYAMGYAEHNKDIDMFVKRHKLVHNGGFLKFEVSYCRQNAIKSTKILTDPSYQVHSFKS